MAADERVALTLHAIRAVKVPTADAGNDPLLAPSHAEGPRVVVLGLDGRAVTVVPLDRVTGSTVYDGLRTVIREGYGANLDDLLLQEKDVRREMDRLDVERRSILLSPLSDSEWKQKSARLEDRKRDLEAKQRAIWALKSRTA